MSAKDGLKHRIETTSMHGVFENSKPLKRDLENISKTMKAHSIRLF